MTTLFERLRHYCDANGQSMPYGRHLRQIGDAVIDAVKSSGSEISKVEIAVPMVVNHYPAELVPIIDDVITRFFCDRHGFIQERLRPGVAGIKEFPYDVETGLCDVFEHALTRCGLPVKRNDGFGSKTKVQYLIPVSNPRHLVKLGKEFEWERWHATRKPLTGGKIHRGK